MTSVSVKVLLRPHLVNYRKFSKIMEKTDRHKSRLETDSSPENLILNEKITLTISKYESNSQGEETATCLTFS